MAVAAIAVYEWPESWPDLLLFLLKLIGDQTSMNEGVEKERGCNSTTLNQYQDQSTSLSYICWHCNTLAASKLEPALCCILFLLLF
ncbi:hypothetical protein ES332_A10G136200v1 [Gossypium tomentosum]|uniref:Exportin-1/Importin-beta-like domain-containing protein n=1 Tax=Gossypium tomentosum TaxID=34277 RepID=A0A5D2NPN5_GOSTO|nr:hypothetical protein ES332_A10G136200v1 [Gossypium tomentosum]